MPIYCVCCELTGTTEHLRVLLPTLGTIIAGLGPYLRVAPTTWLVETEATVEGVLGQLWPQVLDIKERVLVFAVGAGSAWGLHSGSSADEAAEWLGQHLPG
jgi:hypothetical protein